MQDAAAESGALAETIPALAFSDKLPRVGAELLSIPWGHIKLLIDKCKNEPKKYCFIPAKLLKITGPAQSCRICWIQIFMNVKARQLPILP